MWVNDFLKIHFLSVMSDETNKGEFCRIKSFFFVSYLSLLVSPVATSLSHMSCAKTLIFGGTTMQRTVFLPFPQCQWKRFIWTCVIDLETQIHLLISFFINLADSFGSRSTPVMKWEQFQAREKCNRLYEGLVMWLGDWELQNFFVFSQVRRLV